MASNLNIKTRILIISDTHSALPASSETSVPFRQPLPKADVLLHAGDLTMNGRFDQHERAVELIKSHDAELKVVIPGNHDLTLDRDYYRQYPLLHTQYRGTEYDQYDDAMLDSIEELYTGKEAQATGIVYMVEGVRTFTLKNGAMFTVYASAYQPEFCNWAFGYARTQDRFNADGAGFRFTPRNPVPETGIDVMLTHGPPMGILDETSREEHVGCKHLRRAVERCKPQLHAFGHIHEGWGAVKKSWAVKDGGEESITELDEHDVSERMGAYHDATGLQAGKETLFVNAAIMDLAYKPLQAPWIVDLMLPSARDE